MNLKKIEQIPLAFPPHKVTIKAIQSWNGRVYTFMPPCNAIDYLCRREAAVTIIKQRETSIKIIIECSDDMYERLKLDFVRTMGDKYLWKD